MHAEEIYTRYRPIYTHRYFRTSLLHAWGRGPEISTYLTPDFEQEQQQQ
jgi:hypothetical protein